VNKIAVGRYDDYHSDQNIGLTPFRKA